MSDSPEPCYNSGMPAKQKSSEKSRELRILLAGLLLIVAVMFITLFRPDNNASREEALPQTTAEYNNIFNTLSFIQAEALQKKLSQETSLGIFDLRDPSLFSDGHISGSVNATSESIGSAYQGMQPKPGQIVLVDTAAETTAIAQSVQILRNLGMKNIVVLSGGYATWNPFAYQTVSSGDPDSFTDVAKVRLITPEEARKLRGRTDMVFLDTRSKQAYIAMHLDPSINIPLAELESRQQEIPQTQEIVVYGANELESFRSGVRLFDLGILRVQTLRGGFDDLRDPEPTPAQENGEDK